MPLPDRVLAAETGGEFTDEAIGSGAGGEPAQLRARALDVLLDPSLAHVVDLVAYADGAQIVVADAQGEARISRADPTHRAEVVRGRDPIAAQDPFDDESYPFAGVRLANLFLDPRAPDLAVVHTGAHYWPERGGHLGEHGSLGAVQSRAPLLISGHGVRERGVLARVARVVDIGATLCHLTGAPHDDMDGVPLADLATPGARHVIGLLWDGAQCSDLLELALAGELSAVKRLLDNGCALRGGAVAEFPSVTLVNHTCALTGVGPGRHGIVNNAFFDRATGDRAVPNDSSHWHHAMDYLRPGVRTVFERIGADVFTACVNDPVDRGATYSTFGLIRMARESGEAPEGARSMREMLPDPAGDPHASQEFVAANPDYAWGSQVDASGLEQVLGLWSADPPALTWWNTTLTDSGHHAGGPGSPIARASLRDADRRLGVFLDRLDELGLAAQTTILLTADHGSQAADPSCRGDWDEALRAAGIPFRDEAYGFVYLGT